MLHRDILVLHRARRILGVHQHVREVVRDVHLVHLHVPRDPRLVVDRLFKARRERTRPRAHFRKQVRNKPLRVLHKGKKQMFHVDLLLAVVPCHVLRRLDRFADLRRIFISIHVFVSFALSQARTVPALRNEIPQFKTACQ